MASEETDPQSPNPIFQSTENLKNIIRKKKIDRSSKRKQIRGIQWKTKTNRPVGTETHLFSECREL